MVDSMEPETGQTYMFLPTAKELQDVVVKTYSDIRNSAQVFEITNKIRELKQSLNKELDEVHGRILGKDPLASLQAIFSKVRRKESRRLSHNGIFHFIHGRRKLCTYYDG